MRCLEIIKMINEQDLAQFYGTEHYHRWSALFPNMYLTDGVQYVAENGGSNGAFWLMDAIASHQRDALKIEDLQEMQFWTLKVNPNKSAVLTCQIDSDVPPSIIQNIPYTDFDMEKIDLWVAPADERNYVIYLPSEH